MKIYIVDLVLLEDIDKHFYELTDEEVIKLCEKDKAHNGHDVYNSIEELSGYWNSDEIFAPNNSYMRVINDERTYTYKEMENAVHLASDLIGDVLELADDDYNRLEDMRERAEFFIDKAVELDKRLEGKDEDEGNYDYVEELEKFEKEVIASIPIKQ